MGNGVPSVAGEFASVKLGDARLNKRLGMAVERLSSAPDLGFPRALVDGSETEGFYRLLSNDKVKYGRLVEAHAKQTVGRMPEGGVVRVIHDTTEFSFSDDDELREGLGRLRTKNGKRGFLSHVSLAVEATEGSKPLGVVNAVCWARTAAPRPGGRKISGAELAKFEDKESNRWNEAIEQVEARIAERCSAIHLMDREADSYTIFARMHELGARYVVRMARDRVVEADDDPKRLSEALLEMPKFLEREVALTRRAAKPTPRSSHGQRQARSARLRVRAGQITLRKSRYHGSEVPDELDVNVVYVHEVDVPKDADPVAWVLVTSESIETPEDVAAVVDHYRARWMIEELFKALKTGCAFEKRQLESFDTLTNALALFFPIAWQMLLLRTLSRLDPEAPATNALTPTQIVVLQHYQPKKMPREGATAKHALYAVAGLGGHLKNNGPPGWRTLAYGMQKLTLLTDAWEAAIASATSSSRTPSSRKKPKTAGNCDQ